MPDLDAGKHALFVWSSFAATAAAFAWMIADTLVRARRARRDLERLARSDSE